MTEDKETEIRSKDGPLGPEKFENDTQVTKDNSRGHYSPEALAEQDKMVAELKKIKPKS